MEKQHIKIAVISVVVIAAAYGVYAYIQKEKNKKAIIQLPSGVRVQLPGREPIDNTKGGAAVGVANE